MGSYRKKSEKFFKMKKIYPKQKEFIFLLIKGAIIILGTLAVLVPFIYLFLNSIKPEFEFLSVPPKLFPSRIMTKYYSSLLASGSETLKFLFNSLLVTGATTILAVFGGALAAYSLSHLRVSPKTISIIIFSILLVRFYPKITTVIPYFILMKKFHLLDTLISIIIAHVSITVPFVVLLMMSFFREIPPSIEESAKLDGCNVWQVFCKIVLPLSSPGLATSAVLTAIISWNEFLIASSLASVNAKTLPIAVSSFITDKGILWGPMSAMTTLIVIPIVLFTLLLQKYLVRGLTLGAVK
ncbi:carbohydrate ABC transporter permease [Candidatus Aerophobetes bacterium]|uniref:Carbohydrate ABC transporter permease n=1 Tax=Aerophobetes bacterium TaxID=2030807 RepID=A0A662DBH0_UNCAE|nr:MAG: carbohydrate ABC transporter permease [Candidatus Aerophobetes bacterium]